MHRRRRSKALFPDSYYILDVCAILITVILALRYIPDAVLMSVEWFAGNQIVRFGLAVVLAVIVLIDFILKRRKMTAYMMVPLIVVIIEGLYYIPILKPDTYSQETPRIRVFTQNTGTLPRDGLVGQIVADGVDIACLQEVYVENLEFLLDALTEAGYNTRYVSLRDDAGMGTVIATRYPIVSHDTLSTSSWKDKQRRFQRARIDVNGQYVTVLTVQLESTNRRNDLWGVARSWKLRNEQAEHVSEALRGSPDLVIVAGDFNATPTNRAIRPLFKRFDDSWKKAGRGLGGTWPRRMAFLRIDYVLERGFAGATNAARIPVGQSDHLAYRVDLIIP